MKSTKPKLTAHQEFMRKRDSLLPELVAFERKYGAKLARSAMHKHVTTQVAKEKRQAQIRKLQRELAALKS
jgi:hypothetical protein